MPSFQVPCTFVKSGWVGVFENMSLNFPLSTLLISQSSIADASFRDWLDQNIWLISVTFEVFQPSRPSSEVRLFA